MARIWTYWFRPLACICCLSLLACGLYWTIRIGYADYLFQRSSQDIMGAIELTPDRAEYWTRLAEVQDNDGKDPRAALETAARLNPLDAGIPIRLGLEAEIKGDYRRAEAFFFKAASLSKQFDARWTLANYFFRRGDDRFWRWAREALLVSYGDRFPLFQLCWNYNSNATGSLAEVIPDERIVLASYLGYLMVYHRLPAAGSVVQRLIGRAEADDIPNLLEYVDWLIGAGEPSAALDIWNSLCQRKLIPYPPLLPETGEILTNGNLMFQPLAKGFDWRLAATPQIPASWTPEEAGQVRVTLTGNQPDAAEVLSQFLPALPGRRYELEYEYQVSGIQGQTGLIWSVFQAGGEKGPLGSRQFPNAELKRDIFQFSAPNNARFVRLALFYRRDPGMVRAEGAIVVRDLRLRAVQ